ncbi:MAG TPA: hypothetical protein VFE24_12680 [Pirellulales bacterium]|jgi:hypothetical protein|nr:hypothetical protein [Pirellulales bacterium]
MKDTPNQGPNRAELLSRLLGAAFGIAFGGVGIAVAVGMWGADAGPFGGAPLLFKVVATLIAIPFIVFGAVAVLACLFGKRGLQSGVEEGRRAQDLPQQAGPANLHCPNCGAPWGAGAEGASPHGDVKCAHCGAWYNIYGR